jgi:hypothetical protein
MPHRMVLMAVAMVCCSGGGSTGQSRQQACRARESPVHVSVDVVLAVQRVGLAAGVAEDVDHDGVQLQGGACEVRLCGDVPHSDGDCTQQVLLQML